MVCPQVVNLFLQDVGPEVFADELNDVQLAGEARRVPGEALGHALSHSKAQFFQFGHHMILWGGGENYKQ